VAERAWSIVAVPCRPDRQYAVAVSAGEVLSQEIVSLSRSELRASSCVQLARRPRRRMGLLKGCEQPFHPKQALERYCSVRCRAKAQKWSVSKAAEVPSQWVRKGGRPRAGGTGSASGTGKNRPAVSHGRGCEGKISPKFF